MARIPQLVLSSPMRIGDETLLYMAGALARDPDTGAPVWFYGMYEERLALPCDVQRTLIRWNYALSRPRLQGWVAPDALALRPSFPWDTRVLVAFLLEIARRVSPASREPEWVRSATLAALWALPLLKSFRNAVISEPEVDSACKSSPLLVDVKRAIYIEKFPALRDPKLLPSLRAVRVWKGTAVRARRVQNFHRPSPVEDDLLLHANALFLLAFAISPQLTELGVEF